MAGKGLSTPGLLRLHDALAEHVESGALPGLVALVARHDDLDIDVIGTMAFDDPEPMPRNAIFRIASLSKPIAAAAAMSLVDAGVLRLDAPVDELLPELADRRVLRSLDAGLADTEPARRAITLDDLLTCRLGLGCVMAAPGTYPIQDAEQERRLMTFGPPWPPPPYSPDEWIARFAELPLIHQPGEGWLYNTGIQVLGVLLERAAGKPLEAVLRERVLDPLGMSDTRFSVPAAQRARFTTAYIPDPVTGEPLRFDGADGYWSSPPSFPNAAGWLVSTIDDFWSFASMLVNGGVSDGDRVLSAGAVALMTTNHLSAEQRDAADLFVGPGSGWGFGMATPLGGAAEHSAPPGFGWHGGTGTSWFSDPATGLTGILMTQRAMTSPAMPSLYLDFWQHAHQASA
jgi:CubicO group peptidase (beta-lactamase class C family)